MHANPIRPQRAENHDRFKVPVQENLASSGKCGIKLVFGNFRKSYREALALASFRIGRYHSEFMTSSVLDNAADLGQRELYFFGQLQKVRTPIFMMREEMVRGGTPTAMVEIRSPITDVSCTESCQRGSEILVHISQSWQMVVVSRSWIE